MTAVSSSRSVTLMQISSVLCTVSRLLDGQSNSDRFRPHTGIFLELHSWHNAKLTGDLSVQDFERLIARGFAKEHCGDASLDANPPEVQAGAAKVERKLQSVDLLPRF